MKEECLTCLLKPLFLVSTLAALPSNPNCKQCEISSKACWMTTRTKYIFVSLFYITTIVLAIFELQTLCKRKLYDLYLSFYLGQLVFYVIVLCKIAYNSINKTKEEINEIRLMLFLSEYIKKCKRDGLSYKSVSQLFVKGLVLVLIWDMMQIYYFLASLSMSDAILKSFALIFRGKLPINVLSL